MALHADLITQFRIIINDIGVTPTWSDTQLSQYLCIAASQLNGYLTGIISFTISFSGLTIVPDPHDSSLVDPTIEQLLLLKAAENLNDSEIKSAYASAGYKIVDDKSTIDTTTLVKSLSERRKMYSSRFDNLLRRYLLNNRTPGLGVATPFLDATY